MEDKDRVALIMAKFNLTSNNFAAKANLSPATLSHILTGRSKPTLTILRNIVAGFPELNPEWVMLGTGDMYRNCGNDGSSDQVLENGDDGGDGEDSSSDGSHVQSGAPVYSTGDLFAVANIGRDTQPASPQRAASSSRPRLDSEIESRQRNVRNVDAAASQRDVYDVPSRQQRKIVEIRIFFDDGTYETFGHSK